MGILRDRINTGRTFSDLLNDPNYHPLTLQEPDLETLEDWMMDSGCEAACEHGCWVEPDGICEHGKESWLLKMGLI